MNRENLKARFLRALSGRSQHEFAEALGVSSGVVVQVEAGRMSPDGSYLEQASRTCGLTSADAESLLRRAETLRRLRQRPAADVQGVLGRLAAEVHSHAEQAIRHVGTLPLPSHLPRAEDRQRAEVLFERLATLPVEARRAVVQVAEEYQGWALCEKVCHASEREASRDLESAAAWAEIASEIAVRVRGPKGWRSRLQGYAGAHAANVVRVMGELEPADAGIGEAKRLWASGSAPGGLIDPGRMLDLEASLRRDQRRFDEALTLLDESVMVGRCPERALVKKGYTLEVMGEYERAIETLLAAAPRVDRDADPRLGNILDFNLATNYVHVGRHREAADLVPRIRILATELGDRWDLVRLGWLEGRIAAGLGKTWEARKLLAQARRDFEARSMSYDVSLVLLEESVLLLEDGEQAEVRVLAAELAKVFESKGVHREALAALRLFQEAAEHEAATAELARRVLRYLFRARHDSELPFELLTKDALSPRDN